MARELITLQDFRSNFTLAAGFGISEEITFENKRFDFEVTIEPIHRPLVFVNCFFDEDVNFVKGNQIVRLSDNTAENSFDYADYETNSFEASVTFEENCEFLNTLNTKNIVFKENFRLHNSVISKVNFGNTKFEKLADFWSSTFISKTIFLKTDFNDTVVFSMATFKENVLFTYTLFSGKSIFSRTKFNKGIDLSQAIIAGDLKPFDLHFNFNNYEAIYIGNNDKKYQNHIDNIGIIPLVNKVHTFQILKKAFQDIGNYSDSIAMQREEKNALSVLTKERLKKENKALVTNKVNQGDKVILFFNRWSNNYGSDFRNGIWFTFSLGFVFYLITLLFTFELWSRWDVCADIDTEVIGYFIGGFINFLNPIHKMDYLLELKPIYGIAYIFDFVGRITVGYGVYQTIQAFRKFK